MVVERRFIEVSKSNAVSYNGIEHDLCLTQSQQIPWSAFAEIIKEVYVGFEDLNQKITAACSYDRPTFLETCDYFSRIKRTEAIMAHKLSSGAKSLYPVLSPRQRTHLDLFLRSHPAFINPFSH